MARSLAKKELERRRLIRWCTEDPIYWLTSGATKTKDEQDPENPYKPFPDYPYFRDVYACWLAEPILFVEKSRTMMLTWLFAGLCLHYAMTHKATKVIFWGPDEDRALQPLEYSIVALCVIAW